MPSIPCITVPDIQVIGKCKGCGKTHDGPLLLSIDNYEGTVCLTLAAEDGTEDLHPISVIDIREIGALLAAWEDSHPND